MIETPEILDVPDTLMVPEVKTPPLTTRSPDEHGTEFDFACALKSTLPPIRTVGTDWYAHKDGTWHLCKRDTFRPDAQGILPPSIRTARRAGALLDHLEGELQCDDRQFRGFSRFDDKGAILLNVRNGVVRLDASGDTKLLPHDAEHMFTRQAAANYDPSAKADLFLRVLEDSLPDTDDRHLLTFTVGNFLLPDCRFEVATCWYGEAGRGKSTVAEPIAEALGNGLVTRLSMAQLCDPRSYHVPQLRYAAVNLGTELDAVPIEESAAFKTIVSGEPIEARPIYGAPFTMHSTAKLWFLANGLPRFKHGTEAEMRRLRFIRFDQLPKQKDVTLRSRLKAERDGVFNFMLQGLRDLLTLREIPIGSANSKQVQERFRISNDPLGAFVQSECVLEPASWVTKDRLTSAFVTFCTRHGLTLGDDGVWLYRKLYERFPQLEGTRRRVSGEQTSGVSGLRIKERIECD